MTREEDNRRMIEATTHSRNNITYNEAVIDCLATISTILFDISKSLAIISDALRPERDLREFLKEDYGEPEPEDRNE